MNERPVDIDFDDIIGWAVQCIHGQFYRVRYGSRKPGSNLRLDKVGATGRGAGGRLLNVVEEHVNSGDSVLEAQVTHARTVPSVGRYRNHHAGLLGERLGRGDI